VKKSVFKCLQQCFYCKCKKRSSLSHITILMKNRGKNKKSNLSSRNDSVNPGKRPQDGATGSSSSTIYADAAMASPGSQTFVPAMNMASLGPYSAYQTPMAPMGAFYSPVPTPTQPQSGSFQHATGQSPQLPQSQNSFDQIYNRLNSLDKRLEKLDSIEKKLTNMNSKISNIDLRVSSLEHRLKTFPHV